MSAANQTLSETFTSSGTVRRVVLVAAASLLLGGLTSWAQGFLPEAFSSFANSVSGWTVLTAALVYWSRLRGPGAAAVGVLSFVLLVLGYTVASDLRGLSYDPMMWSAIGVVAGPFVGLAAAWLREEGVRLALGVAALTGIGVGDAVHGLTVVGDTTSPVYWTLVGAAGLALLVGMLARRLRGAVPVAVALAGTAAATGVLLLGYRVIGGA